MSKSIPAIYSNGVFKPLKKIDLPPEPQTYLIVIISKEDIEKMPSSISSTGTFTERRLFALLAELKTELLALSAVDFQFDEEHRQLFLENAQTLAPLIL